MQGRTVAVVLVSVLLAAGCSRSGASTATPAPIQAEGTVTARELPGRLLDNYKLNREAQFQAPDEQTGYRFGNLDTVLFVFQTSAGSVFADRGGGGMAWSESCDAMDIFVRANGWNDASACLDG
jgi:hypothetical protein